MRYRVGLSWFLATGIEILAGGWIPHVPPPESPYEMTLSLISESSEVQEVRFVPYDAQGLELAPFEVELPSHAFILQSIAGFLDPLTSHIQVECQSCLIQWSYDLKNQGPGQPLFALHPGSTYQACFDWNHDVEGAFGLALVNTTDRKAAVELVLQSQNKVVRRDQIELNARAKALVTQETFDEFEQVELGIRSDQTLAIVAAQRSWAGSTSNFFPRRSLSEWNHRPQDLVEVPDGTLRQVLLWLVDHDPENGRISHSEMMQLKTLDCSSRGIRSLVGLEAAANLRELLCNDNQIMNAGPIEELTQLEVLDVSDNPWSEPPKLEQFTNLHTLAADYLGLVEIPDTWLALPLRELSLYWNRIAAIDPHSFPDSLKTVNLRYNRLTSADFSEAKIEWLDISGNWELTDRGLMLPSTLRTLGVSHCGILEFKYELPMLEELDLGYNEGISEKSLVLPESLQSLNLRACAIDVFNLQLPNLKRLDLRSTHASLIATHYPGITHLAINPKGNLKIPDQVIQLTQLEELMMRGGDLIDIDGLLQLPYLKKVDLTHNDLRENVCPVLLELVNRRVEVFYYWQGTYSLTCSAAKLAGGR